MAYVPGCRHDLFISYATENNRDGWVEQFEKALGQELGDLLGRQFSARDSIFFDKRELEAGQSYPNRLVTAARESAVLIPILSPTYLTSHWCNRERTEFFTQLPHGAEPASCLAPVLVRPISEEGLDPLYHDAQRMSFLSADEQTPLAAGSPDWIARLRKFAHQLKNVLEKLRKNCKPVFLGKAAETESLHKLRERLETELNRRNFRTVPESLPALDHPDAVRAGLQAAGLAIHFMGGVDSAAIEGMETSITVCAGPTILYQPFGAELLADEKLWLDDFERQAPPEPGRYQRLTGKSDQELLALIDEQITRARGESGKAVGAVELALICEESDLDGVRRLKTEIKGQRPVEVESPDFLEERLKAMERLRKWQAYLAHSENLLFYYGAAEYQRLDLLWQTAQQRRPQARRNWFLGPPDLGRKRQQYPDALWNLDQVIGFIGRTGSAQRV